MKNMIDNIRKGKQPLYDEPMIAKNIKMPQSWWDAVDKQAGKRGRARYIRGIIEHFICELVR